MPFFSRPHYTSDATNFINQLKSDRPELDAQQRQGRALLWDKKIDRQAWDEYNDARVPQQAYVYQTTASE